jgi:hypothetical protein
MPAGGSILSRGRRGSSSGVWVLDALCPSNVRLAHTAVRRTWQALVVFSGLHDDNELVVLGGHDDDELGVLGGPYGDAVSSWYL